MKKGLFSILAGALLVVGCQNYDDQFSNIESQITALASQVAGLSQVQSDLTSLAGTVNALQANIGDTVDAALADGLADIDTAVASLEAATESAASSEDVAAIASAVSDQQEDLDAILQASQFFTGNIVVTNTATLETYHNARAGFKIINGNVTITADSTMDLVKVQELVDAISQATGSYTYTAGAGVTDEIYFNELTSTATLTIDQQGGYELKTLANATVVSLDYHATTDIVHLGALTSVISLESTGDGAGTFHFKNAAEMHLTSLPRYGASGAGTLSLKVAEGAVIDITALTDASAAGVKQALALTIDGPTSVTVPGLTGDKTGSSLTLANVATVNLTNYDGAVSLGKEVLNFTSNGVVDLTITDDDLQSFDATGILDPNASTADKVGPTINLTSHGDLTSVKLAGTVYSATISNTGVATIDLGGDADALVVQNGITIVDNDDVTSVDMTGSTASGVTFSRNESLESLTVDVTFAAGVSSAGVVATAGINGTVSIVGNEDLATVEISSTKIESLTVTGNEDLTSLSATGALAATATAAIGATGKATVNIYNNGLTATSMVDTIDTVTTPAAAIVDGGVSDIGVITTTSGLGTFKAYFTVVDADADSAAAVYFDTVDQFTSEGGVNTTGLTWTQAAATAGTLPGQIKVLVLTANTQAAQVNATTAKRAFLFGPTNQFLMYANGTKIDTGTGTVGSAASANQQTFINAITDTDELANAAAAGISMSATKNARPISYFAINVNSSVMENSATAASTGFAFTPSDTFTMSVDGLAVTVTTAAVIPGTDTFVSLLVAAWNTKHNATKTDVRWTLATSAAKTDGTEPGGEGSTIIIATAKDPGSRDINAPMSMSKGGSSQVTDTSVGYAIGNTQNFTQSAADNVAQGSEVLVVLTAGTAGSFLSEIGNFGKTQGNVAKNVSTTKGVVELSSSLNINVTPSTGYVSVTQVWPWESRLDVTVPAELVAAALSDEENFSRVQWFN